MTGLVLLLAAGAAWAQTDAGKPDGRIRAADFPTVSRRAPFFEERINAPDARVRREVVEEATYFHQVPDPEYVSFLRLMMADADPVVRGRAVRQLHAMWTAPDSKELPQTFAGYSDEQVVDLSDETGFGRLLEDIRAGGLRGGYAAYVLGLLKYKAAVPDLRMLTGDPNVFVRYSAARALMDCGSRQEAKPALETIVAAALETRRDGAGTLLISPGQRPATARGDVYYAICASRALIEMGGAERTRGLESLAALFGYLETSGDATDQTRLRFVRQTLAATAGTFFRSAAEARDWCVREFGNPPPVIAGTAPGRETTTIAAPLLSRDVRKISRAEAQKAAQEYLARTGLDWGTPERTEALEDGTYRFHYRTPRLEKSLLDERIITVDPGGTVRPYEKPR